MMLQRAALIAVLCGTHAFAAQAPSARGPVANKLLADRPADWVTTVAPGFQIHARRGSDAARDASQIAETAGRVRREVIVKLGARPTPIGRPADLFVFDSRAEIERLTGRPLVGFIQEGESTGVFARTPGYRFENLLRHELTHLYGFELWGSTRAGRWLVEGVAVWASGGCQGHSPDALAAGLRVRGRLVSLPRLATDFDKLAEDVGMSQAGSVVSFLVRQKGIGAIIELWKTGRPSGGHPLGSAGAALEAAWLESLKDGRPAELDIPRAIREGC